MALTIAEMQYRRAVRLLGQIEDLTGYSQMLTDFENQVNEKHKAGRALGHIILAMTNQIDKLKKDLGK